MADEKTFENKIKKFLDDEGCYFIKTHGDRFSKKGTPDLLINCNGFFIGAEDKVKHNPTALQLEKIKNINDSNGFGFILCPSNEVKRIKRYISKNYPEYIDTKVIHFESFKKLIKFLKTYEPIGKDVVY